MHYTYILFSVKLNKFYIGSTSMARVKRLSVTEVIIVQTKHIFLLTVKEKRLLGRHDCSETARRGGRTTETQASLH